MRIRLPFAAIFLALVLLAGYAGLSSIHLGEYINDKALHTLTFFLLTVVFYWILDTSRRRTLNLTLVVCTLGGGIGSEFLQAAIPNGRDFDSYDIAANLVGSLSALGLCSWYHLRMLERRRLRRYSTLPAGMDPDHPDGEESIVDVELGEGVGQSSRDGSSAHGTRTRTLEEEVDNWDENVSDDWDGDDDGNGGAGAREVASTTASAAEGKTVIGAAAEPRGAESAMADTTKTHGD